MNEHLNILRQLMQRKNVAAVIIPGTDPHQSEYTSEHWKLRQWLTGFTGSNGTAVVTLDNAALWTDSRYFLQAEDELSDSGFQLMREGIEDDPTITEWLAQNLEEDDVLAIDGRLFSVRQASRMEQFCGENGFMFATDFPVADSVWTGRPARPLNPIVIHDEQYAGEGVADKLTRTRDKMAELGADGLLIASLDDVAWLFNIRGTDVQFSPLAVAFAFVNMTEAFLFIDKEKVDDDVRKELKKYDVNIKPYDDVEHFLSRQSEHKVVIIDPDRISDTLANALPCQKVYAPSPTVELKAVKNDVQIQGFHRAMERDGVALVRTLMWLEQNVASGNITEITVWDKAREQRAVSSLYRDESFNMIAGYREHGAIVHYAATPETAFTIQPTGLLLIDTGAQYLDGTTDITRTFSLGDVTEQERCDYTLVLKGHLALSRARFPEGTCGVQLDALARMPLWQQGLSFGHGTGHGVGHYLCCHEGPQSIRTNLNPTPLRPGMVVSNEPGIYRSGQYGIRIENLMLCVDGANSQEFGKFLRFETLTLFPYDKTLINRQMLTPEEIGQINDYHSMVFSRLSPLLSPDEVDWLKEKCAPL